MMSSVAVIVRTRDEAPRLRLTLASLERQGADEIVVVNDGSVDDTPNVLAQSPMPLTVIAHSAALGRSAATNAGASAARSDILLFLDGDTLAGPGMVAAHRQVHGAASDKAVRGEGRHLRCTRFLSDPEGATFWPHEAERARNVSAAERESMRVTLAQVRHDFASIERRSAPGIYPGVAPARLHAAEMAALASGGANLWAAASGSNFSVRRESFLAVGGFDPAIDINEHRELAYRLCAQGTRMARPRPDARSYHLTHRTGWRDPLTENGWEQRFRARHPEAPIDALNTFWASLSRQGPVTTFFAP